METGEADAEERWEYCEAYDAGQAAKALGVVTRGLSIQLLDLLRRDGLTIEFNREPVNSMEYFGGLVACMTEFLDREGDAASYKVGHARDLATALANLQFFLVLGSPEGADDHDVLALGLIRAMAADAAALGGLRRV